MQIPLGYGKSSSAPLLLEKEKKSLFQMCGYNWFVLILHESLIMSQTFDSHLSYWQHLLYKQWKG